MLYCNSEKILREKAFADQFTESDHHEHFEEKTFTESPLAKPIGAACYNFNFYGPGWLSITVKFMNTFSLKVSHYTSDHDAHLEVFYTSLDLFSTSNFVAVHFDKT